MINQKISAAGWALASGCMLVGVLGGVLLCTPAKEKQIKAEAEQQTVLMNAFTASTCKDHIGQGLSLSQEQCEGDMQKNFARILTL